MSESEKASEETKEVLRTIVDDIEGGRLGSGVTIQQVHSVYNNLTEALSAYKAGTMPKIGMGKNRGYGLAGGLGITGLLSIAAGGVFLAKGKAALGALGLGAGAGIEVGAYISLPSRVPIVGYFYEVRSDHVEGVYIERYVLVKIPLGLSDEAFERRSKCIIRQKIKEGAFVTPSAFQVEIIENRRAQEDDLKSALPPPVASPPDQEDDPDSSSDDKEDPAFSEANDDEKVDPTPAPEPPAPEVKSLSSVVDDRSSAEKAAQAKASGFPVVPSVKKAPKRVKD